MTLPIQPGSKAPLLGTIVLLLVLAFLPGRWLGWTTALAGVTTRAVAPVSGPVYRVTRWVLRDGGSRDDVLMAQIERDRDQFRTMWLQELKRNEDLRRDIEQIHPGALPNELPVSPLLRPVVGTSSEAGGGQLEVRAGSGEGVDLNVVATTRGVQLVGKVATVNSRTSWVRLITHPGAGQMSGVVMTAEDKPGWRCLLSPFKGSRLQGLVEYSKDSKASPTVGLTVVLDDSQWPKSARMLVLGTITNITTLTNGRQRIEVRPTAELDRLSEVVLRLTPKDDDGRSPLPAPAPASTTASGNGDGQP